MKAQLQAKLARSKDQLGKSAPLSCGFLKVLPANVHQAPQALRDVCFPNGQMPVLPWAFEDILRLARDIPLRKTRKDVASPLVPSLFQGLAPECLALMQGIFLQGLVMQNSAPEIPLRMLAPQPKANAPLRALLDRARSLSSDSLSLGDAPGPLTAPVRAPAGSQLALADAPNPRQYAHVPWNAGEANAGEASELFVEAPPQPMPAAQSQEVPPLIPAAQNQEVPPLIPAAQNQEPPLQVKDPEVQQEEPSSQGHVSPPQKGGRVSLRESLHRMQEARESVKRPATEPKARAKKPAQKPSAKPDKSSKKQSPKAGKNKASKGPVQGKKPVKPQEKKKALKPEKKPEHKSASKKNVDGEKSLSKKELKEKLLRTIPAHLKRAAKDGCSRCRYVKFCTISCWASKGWTI